METLKRFFTAPFRARSYANFFYLALAFPLGLAYFIFLVVGLSVGLSLTLIWVGIPILALVFLASWGLIALERAMAVHLLGAAVPPMTRPAAPEGFWRTVGDFFANPVTWKGMGYLFLKFPLGLATFVIQVFLVSLAGGLLAAPAVYDAPLEWEIYYDFYFWVVDTPAEAWACFAMGLGVLWVALNVFNGLAAVFARLSEWLLGSESFRRPPAAAPALTA
jgi:hypothetical protein